MKQNVFGPRVHVPTMAILAMIMQPLAAPFAATAATTPPAANKPEVFKASLYDLDNQRKTPLFFYERTESTQGADKHVEATFKDAKGKLVVTEKLTYAAGKVERYDYEQKQNKQSGSVEFQGDHYHLTYVSEGKTKTADLSRSDNTVVGPTILYYLGDHWGELEKGKDVEVKIIVIDRQDTFTFKFQNDGEEQLDGRTTLRVKLKPTSFLISAVVAPIYFYFDKATHKLLVSKGRTLLRYERDNDMHDFFAETVFE